MSKKNQDEPLAEPESEGIWISALDALQMLSPLMPSELAKTTIIDRAYAGLIASRAEHYSLIPRRGKASNFQKHNLPNFFFGIGKLASLIYLKIGKSEILSRRTDDFAAKHSG